MTITGGSTIDFTPIIPPGGTDNQELTFDETTKMLEIEDGNSVDLSSLSSGSTVGSLWNEDTNGVSRLTGQVGIGHQSGGDAKLFVQNGLPDIRNGISSSVFNNGYKAAISASAEARGSDPNNTFGVRSSARAESTGSAWAYRGDIGGAGTGRKYGLDLIFYDGTGGEKYGVFSKGEDKNYFSGDLGVGTENPTSKLDVDGSIRSRGLSGSGQRNVVADAEGNLVIGTISGGSSLWSESGDDINFEGGKVGIGTTNPVNSLQIVSDDNSPARFQSTSDQSWVSFYNSSGYVGYAGVFTNGQDMDFGTGLFNGTSKVHLTTGAIPKLTVVPNGNVGIGTTAPSVKLDVAGDVKTSGEVHGPATGNANMIPVAYGKVAADGVIEEGSGNFTISKTGNYYFIVIDGYSVSDAGECSMVATRRAELGFITVGFGSSGGSGALFARTYNISGTASDSPFSFIIYRQ